MRRILKKCFEAVLFASCLVAGLAQALPIYTVTMTPLTFMGTPGGSAFVFHITVDNGAGLSAVDAKVDGSLPAGVTFAPFGWTAGSSITAALWDEDDSGNAPPPPPLPGGTMAIGLFTGLNSGFAPLGNSPNASLADLTLQIDSSLTQVGSFFDVFVRLSPDQGDVEDFTFRVINSQIAQAPEPGSLLLLGIGLAGLGWRSRAQR